MGSVRGRRGRARCRCFLNPRHGTVWHGFFDPQHGAIASSILGGGGMRDRGGSGKAGQEGRRWEDRGTAGSVADDGGAGSRSMDFANCAGAGWNKYFAEAKESSACGRSREKPKL